MAEIYLESGKLDEGFKAFNQCIKIDPQHANAYYGKAKLSFMMSRTQEAIDSLKSAFKLDPNIKNRFARDYPDANSSKLIKILLDEN